jgi:hypothetical protein
VLLRLFGLSQSDGHVLDSDGQTGRGQSQRQQTASRLPSMRRLLQHSKIGRRLAAQGQTLTCRPAPLCLVPPAADFLALGSNVPKPAVSNRSKTASLFKQRRRHVRLLWPRRREDDSLEGHATIGPEFAAEDLCYGANDSIRINTAAFSDLVD